MGKIHIWKDGTMYTERKVVENLINNFLEGRIFKTEAFEAFLLKKAFNVRAFQKLL